VISSDQWATNGIMSVACGPKHLRAGVLCSLGLRRACVSEDRVTGVGTLNDSVEHSPVMNIQFGQKRQVL
jgi:hypothetical protein